MKILLPLIALGLLLSVGAFGCGEDAAPLCTSHDQCGKTQICRDFRCLAIADKENLCTNDKDCPAQAHCDDSLCRPIPPLDGDDDVIEIEAEVVEDDTIVEVEAPFSCNDGNECTKDIFDGLTCTHLPVEDDTPCDDGNENTTEDLCVAGVCGGDRVNRDKCCGPDCINCKRQEIDNGEYVCNDDGVCAPKCSLGFRLIAGVCVEFLCDDNNPCTYNGYNETGDECRFPPMPDDEICSETNGQCSYRGTCSDMECLDLTLYGCDDEVDCTVDNCDVILGCVNTPDDDLCEGGRVCHAELGCVIPGPGGK